MKKLIAEFIGTFWLVLGGCGSAILAAGFPGGMGIGFVGVSLAFGLTVLTMAYAVGHISGGHFNPAVSVGLWLGGRFEAKDLPGYIVSQVFGGIAGAAVLYLIASGQEGWATNGFASNGYGDHSPGQYGMVACLVTEIVMTFIFPHDHFGPKTLWWSGRENEFRRSSTRQGRMGVADGPARALRRPAYGRASRPAKWRREWRLLFRGHHRWSRTLRRAAQALSGARLARRASRRGDSSSRRPRRRWRCSGRPTRRAGTSASSNCPAWCRASGALWRVVPGSAAFPATLPPGVVAAVERAGHRYFLAASGERQPRP